jgi:hypothetical protein
VRSSHPTWDARERSPSPCDRRADFEGRLLGWQGPTSCEPTSNVPNALGHLTRSPSAILHKIKRANLHSRFAEARAWQTADMGLFGPGASIQLTLGPDIIMAGHAEVMDARDCSRMPRHVLHRLTRFAVAINVADQLA